MKSFNSVRQCLANGACFQTQSCILVACRWVDLILVGKIGIPYLSQRIEAVLQGQNYDSTKGHFCDIQ
jgi:hypothetical protein